MESPITVEDLRTMLLTVPYDTAMDADGTLYIRGNAVCNVISLMKENTCLQIENKELVENQWKYNELCY